MGPAAVKLELDDIQGIVARGYAELPSACYVLLSIGDRARAGAWLQELGDDVSHSGARRVGGVGSVGGAMAAGLLLGLITIMGQVWLPSAAVVVPYLLLILVLLWRPTGLAGKRLA